METPHLKVHDQSFICSAKVSTCEKSGKHIIEPKELIRIEKNKLNVANIEAY